MEENNFQSEENSQRRKEALEGEMGVMLRNNFGLVILSELVFFFLFFGGYKVSFANIFWICLF